MQMNQNNVFQLIHTMELFNNRAIVEWNKSFPEGLGISPVLTLSFLKQHGPQKQRVLTEALGFTPGAMTNIANQLIKGGYAQRKYDDNDRRVILLDITTAGHDQLEQANKRGQQLHLKLFEALTAEEIQEFLRIYEKLLNYSTDYNQPTST